MKEAKLFLRFLFSGGLFTALDLVLFYSLLNFTSHELAYITAYAFCIVLRYFFDKAFAFKTKNHSIKQLSRYILVNSSVLILIFLVFNLPHYLLHYYPQNFPLFPSP
ncbi:MAG: GtrA family protein [Methylococcaceae bacterium]